MSKDTFGMGIVAGALVGAAAAYFLAPKSGKEYRDELAVKGKEVQRKAVVAADDAVTSAEDWIDNKVKEQNQKTKDYAVRTKDYADRTRDHDIVEVRPKATVVEESYKNL